MMACRCSSARTGAAADMLAAGCRADGSQAKQCQPKHALVAMQVYVTQEQCSPGSRT